MTNGRTDNQRGKLERTGLLDVLDGWCVSEEAGSRKPSPRIFEVARQRCGWLEAEPFWVVGADPVADVVDGAGAGASTLWISHGRPWPETPRPGGTA